MALSVDAWERMGIVTLRWQPTEPAEEAQLGDEPSSGQRASLIRNEEGLDPRGSGAARQVVGHGTQRTEQSIS